MGLCMPMLYGKPNSLCCGCILQCASRCYPRQLDQSKFASYRRNRNRFLSSLGDVPELGPSYSLQSGLPLDWVEEGQVTCPSMAIYHEFRIYSFVWPSVPKMMPENRVLDAGANHVLPTHTPLRH